MADDDEVRRRRALWRASHRGTKEMDVMLGRYAEAHVPVMSGAELGAFEEFLALSDVDLYRWIIDPAVNAKGAHAPLIAALRRFHGLEG